jgi:hypothetical protein
MTNFAMQYKLLFGKFNSLAADNKWRVGKLFIKNQRSTGQLGSENPTSIPPHKYTSWFPPYILAFGGVLQ